MIIIPIIGFTILIVLANAVHDAYRIKQNKHIYHGLNVAIRAVLIAAISFIGFSDILTYFKTFVLCGVLFWALFDYALNKARQIMGEKWIHWWYVSFGSSFIDGFLGKANGYTYRYLRLSIKIILVIIAIIWKLSS